MAGKKQHEIPQLFQRGFLIPSNGRLEQVHVFRLGVGHYTSNILGSGAERFFYSELSTNTEATLSTIGSPTTKIV